MSDAPACAADQRVAWRASKGAGIHLAGRLPPLDDFRQSGADNFTVPLS